MDAPPSYETVVGERAGLVLSFDFQREKESLEAQKSAAVENEDFELAMQLKQDIDNLTKNSARITILEEGKRSAVVKEDYALAQQLKNEISTLKAGAHCRTYYVPRRSKTSILIAVCDGTKERSVMYQAQYRVQNQRQNMEPWETLAQQTQERTGANAVSGSHTGADNSRSKGGTKRSKSRHKGDSQAERGRKKMRRVVESDEEANKRQLRVKFSLPWVPSGLTTITLPV